MQLLKEDEDFLVVLDTIKKIKKDDEKKRRVPLTKGAWKEKRNENEEEGEEELS